MKRLLLAAVAACVLTADASHAANSWNGEKIIATCAVPTGKSKDDPKAWMRATECYGYVRGSGDAFIGSGACLPAAVTTQQLVDVTVKFLRNNPQHRHLDAIQIFVESWGEAWPCQEEKQQEQQQFKPSYKPL
jgi:hypothetical protein